MNTLPMLERFDLLIPTAGMLRDEMMRMALMGFPVTFLLAIAMNYFKEGNPDWAGLLRRLFLTLLLLSNFLPLAETINEIGQGIAERIDNLTALETYFDLLKVKAEQYEVSASGILLGANDAIVGVVVYVIFIVVYVARYLILAIYHFYWLLYTVLSPLLCLCLMFRSTAPITGNLIKGLFQVSFWPVIWAVISVIMRSLPVGQAMSVEGSYLTVILLNFVLAIALVGTPFIVSGLTSGLLTSSSQQLGSKSTQVLRTIPGKTQIISRAAGRAASRVRQFNGGRRA